MAAHTELYVDQGTTFNNIITLTDDITNAYINISGYIVRSQMRRSYYSANATAAFTCTVSDASNGEITMSLTADQTSNIKPGRYLFDVEVVNIIGDVSRVLEGTITITPQITR